MSPPRQLTALVTNDDGVDAPGLMVLASAALDAGMRVVVAAPTWDSSGASASFTAVERDGKVLASTRVVSALDDSTVAAVEAAPAFIVRAGVAGAYNRRFGRVVLALTDTQEAVHRFPVDRVKLGISHCIHNL